MELTPATPADLPALHALVERAYRGDEARAGWSHEADLLTGPRTSVEELQSFLDAGDHLLLRRQGEVLCACVRLVKLASGKVYLGMLTVEPAAQGSGLGKRLLAAAEAHARDVMGGSAVEMQVFAPRRELLSFYERRGYRPTGETRPFPYADWPLAGALRDDLEFVVLEKPL